MNQRFSSGCLSTYCHVTRASGIQPTLQTIHGFGEYRAFGLLNFILSSDVRAFFPQTW
jgi:hypothetical protein